MERLLADDFKIVSENGREIKSGFINGFKTPLPKEAGTFEAIDFEHSEVRVYGDTAIMTAKTTYRGKTADGQARNQDFSASMLAVKKKGQWQIVGLHTSTVPDPKADTTSANEMKQTEQEVMAFAKQFADFHVKKDAAAMERLLADNFINLPGDGSMMNKSELINSYKTPLPNNVKLEAIDTETAKVRVFGNTAITTGKAVYHYKLPDGKAVNQDFSTTMVAVKENGQWKVVSLHSTYIEPPK